MPITVDIDDLRCDLLHSCSHTHLFASHVRCLIMALANYILNPQLHVVKYIQYQFEEYLSFCRLYFMEANEGFCWLTIVYICLQLEFPSTIARVTPAGMRKWSFKSCIYRKLSRLIFVIEWGYSK